MEFRPFIVAKLVGFWWYRDHGIVHDRIRGAADWSIGREVPADLRRHHFLKTGTL